VVLSDERYGTDEEPGGLWLSADETSLSCSPTSLDIVGRVSLEALSRIAHRLHKIDLFASAPLRADLGAENAPR
jgi:hypothetical protein